MFDFNFSCFENFTLFKSKNFSNVVKMRALPEKREEKFCVELKKFEKQLFDIFFDLVIEWNRSEMCMSNYAPVDAFNRYCDGRPLRHLTYECEELINQAFCDYCQLDEYGHADLKELLHVKHARTFKGVGFRRIKSFGQFLDSIDFECRYRAYNEHFLFNPEAMKNFIEKVVKCLNQLQVFHNDFDVINRGVIKLSSELSADGYELPEALNSRLENLTKVSQFFAWHQYIDNYLNTSFWAEEIRASNYVLFATFYFHFYLRLMEGYLSKNSDRLADHSKQSA